MLAAIRSEFRKLLTVRSTYFITGLSLLIVMFFAGFIEGFRGSVGSLSTNPGLLASESTNAIVFVGFLLAFVGLLLAGHEYRYNTIMYTLTATNRRYKVLLAKFVAVTVFATAVSLLVVFFAPLCTIVGAALAGKEMGAQQFDVWSIVWRCVFVGWGYSMYAFVLMMIMRNQIGAIITFLLLPLMGESILSVLLKENAKNLPFTSLQSVIAPMDAANHVTSGHQALVVVVYVVVGLLVSFVLFQKRDAN